MQKGQDTTMKSFKFFELVHVPRGKNAKVDLLSNLYSTKRSDPNKTVIQETFSNPNTDNKTIVCCKLGTISWFTLFYFRDVFLFWIICYFTAYQETKHNFLLFRWGRELQWLLYLLSLKWFSFFLHPIFLFSPVITKLHYTSWPILFFTKEQNI